MPTFCTCSDKFCRDDHAPTRVYVCTEPDCDKATCPHNPDRVVQSELNGVTYALRRAREFISGLSQYDGLLLPKAAFSEARGILGFIRGAEQGPRVNVLRQLIERGGRIDELEAELASRNETLAKLGYHTTPTAIHGTHLPKAYAELGHELAVRCPDVAAQGMDNAVDHLRATFSDAKLGHELVNRLMTVCGDGGASEGAVECLERILKEREADKEELAVQKAAREAYAELQAGHLPDCLCVACSGLVRPVALRYAGELACCCGKPGGMHLGGCPLDTFHGVDRTKDKGGGVKERDALWFWTQGVMDDAKPAETVVQVYQNPGDTVLGQYGVPVTVNEIRALHGVGKYVVRVRQVRVTKSGKTGFLHIAANLVEVNEVGVNPGQLTNACSFYIKGAPMVTLRPPSSRLDEPSPYASVFNDGEEPGKPAGVLVPVRANVPAPIPPVPVLCNACNSTMSWDGLKSAYYCGGDRYCPERGKRVQ